MDFNDTGDKKDKKAKGKTSDPDTPKSNEDTSHYALTAKAFPTSVSLSNTDITYDAKLGIGGATLGYQTQSGNILGVDGLDRIEVGVIRNSFSATPNSMNSRFFGSEQAMDNHPAAESMFLAGAKTEFHHDQKQSQIYTGYDVQNSQFVVGNHAVAQEGDVFVRAGFATEGLSFKQGYVEGIYDFTHGSKGRDVDSLTLGAQTFTAGQGDSNVRQSRFFTEYEKTVLEVPGEKTGFNLSLSTTAYVQNTQFMNGGEGETSVGVTFAPMMDLNAPGDSMPMRVGPAVTVDSNTGVSAGVKMTAKLPSFKNKGPKI